MYSFDIYALSNNCCNLLCLFATNGKIGFLGLVLKIIGETEMCFIIN